MRVHSAVPPPDNNIGGAGEDELVLPDSGQRFERVQALRAPGKGVDSQGSAQAMISSRLSEARKVWFRHRAQLVNKVSTELRWSCDAPSFEGRPQAPSMHGTVTSRDGRGSIASRVHRWRNIFWRPTGQAAGRAEGRRADPWHHPS